MIINIINITSKSFFVISFVVFILLLSYYFNVNRFLGNKIEVLIKQKSSVNIVFPFIGNSNFEEQADFVKDSRKGISRLFI